MAPASKLLLLTHLLWCVTLSSGCTAFVASQACSRSASEAFASSEKRLRSLSLPSLKVGSTCEVPVEKVKTSYSPQQKSLWNDLCRAVELEPQSLLRLDASVNGCRGVYLNRSVKAGDVLFSIDIDKCLRDDQPPSWMPLMSDDDSNKDEDQDEGSACQDDCYASNWATRLSACLINEQLQPASEEHIKLWLSLMPNPNSLRASLPIHWAEEIVQSALCTALELSVDTAYFARATAVQDLVDALGRHYEKTGTLKQHDQHRRLAEDALDIVQTRTCRVDQMQKDGSFQAIRLLAPVFDFLNHASPSKASFGLENGNRLVVRALENLGSNQEVTIDYGASTRPDWKCLTSYGFVPPFPSNGNESADEGALAEVYMDGIRYEVGPTFVPEVMVAAARDSLLLDDSALVDGFMPRLAEDDNVELNPEIAVRLARRISDTAYQLLLEPPEITKDELRAAEINISKQLAASLRVNQHRILLKCSSGLRHWAVQHA